jgi:speckle-type POZ protein
MANNFNWIRPEYQLVKTKLEWNVWVPFLNTTEGNGENILSPTLTSQETPNRAWKLGLFDRSTRILINACQDDSVLNNPTNNNLEQLPNSANIFQPVLVKISILTRHGRDVLQQMIPSKPNCKSVLFYLNKDDINQYECQQIDGSLTFRCKIFSHVKKERFDSTHHLPIVAINCSDGLITQLQGLFEGMPLSDVKFIIQGREFPAHRIILAARSEVFAAMFQHQTKENLTNRISIEDIEPEVFHELLRFIYTGRLDSTTMETMAAKLLIVAEKYVFKELMDECENYLVLQMSPVNCAELILHDDLLNPAEYMENVLKEAAQCFRYLPGEVMATSKWEKTEKENPQLSSKVQNILLSKKGFMF